MYKLKNLFIIFFLFAAMPLAALDCPACGGKDIPSLSLVCPDCGIEIHNYMKPQEKNIPPQIRDRKLFIRIYYTGDRPDKLPKHVDVYINGIKSKSAVLVEQQARDPENTNLAWGNGLGTLFTGLYKLDIEELPSNPLSIRLQINEKKLAGIYQKPKSITFPEVYVEEGKTEIIEHSFSSVRSFHRFPKYLKN